MVEQGVGEGGNGERATGGEQSRAGKLFHMVGTYLGGDKLARCLIGELWIAGSHWTPMEEAGKGGGLGHRAKDSFEILVEESSLWCGCHSLQEPSGLAISREHSEVLAVVLPMKWPYGICYSRLLTFVLFVWWCTYNLIHCHLPGSIQRDDRYDFI